MRKIQMIGVLAAVLLTRHSTAEMTVNYPNRLLDMNGKVVCQEEKSEKKCDPWGSEHAVYLGGTSIPSSLQSQYQALQKEFLDEALRQAKTCEKKTAKQYYETYKKRGTGQGRAPGNCLNSDELAKIVERRAALLGSIEDDWRLRPEWRLKRGYLYGGVTTPRGESRFGPYSKKAKKELDELEQDFAVECFHQQLEWNHTGKFDQTPALLEIALRASSLQVKNLRAEDRKTLFGHWRDGCGKPQEPAADRTTRFLLSRKVRGSAYDTGDDVTAWMCHGLAGGVWVEDCGEVKGAATPEAKEASDITKILRGFVPVLKEAK